MYEMNEWGESPYVQTSKQQSKRQPLILYVKYMRNTEPTKPISDKLQAKQVTCQLLVWM